jgi:hypothetical protein
MVEQEPPVHVAGGTPSAEFVHAVRQVRGAPHMKPLHDLAIAGERGPLPLQVRTCV